MDKTKQQMVTGYNHNIKHNGLIYHVQTEDSGVANPHIITHLFVGGNILATKKTSYADIVKADNLEGIVRELMQEQHKAMLRNLVNGVYDDVIEDRMAVPSQLPAEPPIPQPPAAEPAQPAQPQARPTQPQARPAQPQARPVQPAEQVRTEPAMPAARFPAPAERIPLDQRPTIVMPAVQAARQAQQASQTRPEQPVAPPVPRPPPASRPPDTSGEFTEGRRPITGTQIHRPPEPETVPMPVGAPARRVTLRPKTAGEQAARAAIPPEVLAARRLKEKPKLKDISGPTIFGEDLITEKSLDEVILGYLAGDGEEG